MSRHFNTAGLCFPEKHYMIDPLKRLMDLQVLIDQEKYFVLHAPRQTGKTTAMRALMERLNREGTYIALHFSCEAASVTGEDYLEGNRLIVNRILNSANIFLPELERPVVVESASGANLLQVTLTEWATTQTKPIVLLIDEIDSLSDLTLISLLRQLRDGYQFRPGHFPQSIVLIGLKDVRDYKLKVRDELQTMGTASPFNISDESLSIRNFTAQEVAELYQQHTEETGQVFSDEVVQHAFELTQGQPWLVNALAKQCVHRGEKAGTQEMIILEDLYRAKETLIQQRQTHLDSLISKLRESRVQRILAPILTGELLPFESIDDDLLYVQNLGLIKAQPSWSVANPIYHEVIPRALNYVLQGSIPAVYDSWQDADGKLDWPKIWDQFLEFWREVGDPLMRSAPYHEVAPHLVLMAYLQRIANGGGRPSGGQIVREYSIGYKRMDLLVRWPYTLDGQRHWQREAIELKVWKPTDKKDPLVNGLQQLTQYLNGLSLKAGTLIIFDRRNDLPDLEDRVEREWVNHEGKQIQVIRG